MGDVGKGGKTMKRITVRDIAKLANVNVKTVRRIADKGLIESRRDYNGWRIFPNPERAVEVIRQLLLGQTDRDTSPTA